jgi:hypothetical protein
MVVIRIRAGDSDTHRQAEKQSFDGRSQSSIGMKRVIKYALNKNETGVCVTTDIKTRIK